MNFVKQYQGISVWIVTLMSSILFAVESGSDWAEKLPEPPTLQQSAGLGLGPYAFQTAFEEAHLASYAPVNTQTAIGIPGTVPLPFGYVMRSRYSEFDLTFSLETEEDQIRPYTLADFYQKSPGDWLPGCISTWNHGGIDYEVSVIVVPNDPQPIDLYRMVLTNNTDHVSTALLVVTIDGAPTLEIKNGLISDRGKPLIVMVPEISVKKIWRDSGVVDPRVTACGPWEHGVMGTDRWIRHRDGYYGMPIEYRLKVQGDESRQVFLGYGGTPNVSTPNWDEPREAMDPYIRKLRTVSNRGIIATVEGEVNPQRAELKRLVRVVQRFIGKDTDGDGYIRVSVRATPQSRQPACLSWVYAYDMKTKITEDELFQDSTDLNLKSVTKSFLPGPGQPGLPQTLATHTEINDKALCKIDVGADFFDSPDHQAFRVGKDPTVFALKLMYTPQLEPGESKSYLLKLPAIDRPEPAAYGNPCRPYDTKESWKNFIEPRHPDNKTPYGEDVPEDIDPQDYARFGPKTRDLWHKQLAAAKMMTWETGYDNVREFWNDFVKPRAKFISPESLIDNMHKHQLAMLSLYRLQFYPHDYYVSLGGPFFYWDCSAARDVPYVTQAWEISGLHDIAQSYLDTCLTPRSKIPDGKWTYGQWEKGDFDPKDGIDRDGMWLTRTRQYDGQGQTLWMLADHFLFTNDSDWMREHFNELKRGAECLIRLREAQKKLLGNPDLPGYGLMMPGSGEAGGGGYSFYINAFGVMGLYRVARVADLLGMTEDAARYQQETDDFKKALYQAIQAGFIRAHQFAGTIPQNLGEGMGLKSAVDQVWETKGFITTCFGPPLVWPTEIMSPHDPMMNGWNQYMTWKGSQMGGLLEWPYIYGDWAVSFIRRGEPDRAVDILYAYIANASGTLDWAEVMNLNAEYPGHPAPAIAGGGESPHNWACAFYVVLMRNLFLHEEGETLHLAPATPRKWLAQSHTPVGVENAPSFFGPVTYQLYADSDQTTIRGEVKLDPKRKPSRLFIHVRGLGGRGLQSVKINGKNWNAFYNDTVIITNPENSFEIETQYKIR